MRRRRRIKLAFALLFLPALLELGSYLAGRVLQSRWVMYADPIQASSRRQARDYEHYLQLRDPLLGWPYPRELGSERFQADGSIPLPANQELAGAAGHVSLYGDSFTWGLTNATPEQCWANQLARGLGEPVKNFAVPGYGTDQAYLRFLRNEADRGRVVVFGHMAEDVSRNLTRLRDFTAGGAQGFSFKPRLVLGPDGALQLVPLPSLSPAEYRRLLALDPPQLVLEHECFHPGGPLGTVRLEPPFSLALLRNLGYFRLRSRLGRYPEYAPLYAPDHPLGGLQLTRAILLAFQREALRRGQRPLVVLFPGPADAEWSQRTGQRLLDGLKGDLLAAGVDVLDFTPLLLEWLGPRPAGEAFARSHFTPEVEPLVARAVLERIRAGADHAAADHGGR